MTDETGITKAEMSRPQQHSGSAREGTFVAQIRDAVVSRRKVWLFAALLGFVGVVQAQSQLPPCPSAGYKHNCFGDEAYSDGSDYVGEFKDSKRNGLGTYTFGNGNRYVGQFANGEFSGQGAYTIAGGGVYGGEFGVGKFSGTFAWRSPASSTWRYTNSLKNYAIPNLGVLDTAVELRRPLLANVTATKPLDAQSGNTTANPPPLAPPPSVVPPPPGKRIALVIGNGDYKTRPLRNAHSFVHLGIAPEFVGPTN